MTAREKMKQWREAYKLTFSYISSVTGVSAGLIAMIERGQVSHPVIVKKLQSFYDLSDIEAEELLPEIRRPHSPKYNPDEYVETLTDKTCISHVSGEDLYRCYMAERNRRDNYK